MTSARSFGCLILLGLCVSAARAGLHYSGEQIAPLPSQWRGYLLDQRLLRTLALPPAAKTRGHPLRTRYTKALLDLETAAKTRMLSADELADLGALHVRLGNVAQAVTILRDAQRKHPRHYRIISNLGTAWQLSGDLEQAQACLQDAVRLAPGNLQRAEEFQLRLVAARRRQKGDLFNLDPLLDVKFVNDKNEYEAGKIAAEQRKKIPAGAVADLQVLALWLPNDARLLWLLAELAAIHGDLRTAAAIMDGCVNEFALRAPELRQHRQLMREAADKLARASPTTKLEHEAHAGLLKTRSTRPLVDNSALSGLPPVKPDGLNALAWSVVTRTNVDRKYHPTFPAYLRELDGKQVTLTGYMQPIGTDPDMNTFLLIEYPVGCWYCETPDVTAILLIEMPPGKSRTFGREPIQVTGRLKLNPNDPEDFLYKITSAAVKNAE
jgi:hypothetical protein